MKNQKIKFQEAVTIETEQCRNALSAMTKVFRAMALSKARKRNEEVNEEVIQKCQEPPLVEKRKQAKKEAKKDFQKFVRSR